jgi:hypothetical protein
VSEYEDLEPAGLARAGTRKRRFQDAQLDLLREHEVNGELPTSGRFLFYELVQRGVLDKHNADDEKIRSHALFSLRDLGLVPWDWIVDETRAVRQVATWPTVRAAIVSAARGARLSPWNGQPAPLIVTESRSLAGVLQEVAVTYGCPIASTNGQAGGFLRTTVAPLLADRHVLYLGDWDWQGQQIEANTRRVVAHHAPGGFTWERLALTEAQVVKHDLGHLKIRKPDRRYKPVRYHDAVETEALRQSVIVGIVRARLDELLPEPLRAVRERQERERRELVTLLHREVEAAG